MESASRGQGGSQATPGRWIVGLGLLASLAGCPGKPGDSEGEPPADADGDGFPEGEDCDDADPLVSPAGAEVCGGADEDCDGLVDDEDPDVSGGTTWHSDLDGDGWGADDAPVVACAAPADAAGEAGDCDDAQAAVNPGAIEVCGGMDDDCDGLTDDEDDSLDVKTAPAWSPDEDQDGYGDASAEAARSCLSPAGEDPAWIEDATDCDDQDAAVHPGAAEECNGADDDCDGALPAEEADADGDGYAVCEDDPDDTDPSLIPIETYAIGGRDQSWTASNYFRGNVYRAEQPITLVQFEVYLDLPADGCALGFFVFTSPAGTGPFTLAWSSPQTAAGSGYHASGDIGLATTAGQYYTLGVGWECEARYYSSTYGAWAGVDAGIGVLDRDAYSNSYPGYSAGFLPSGTGGVVGANYDQLVTVAP